jgi:hypothetical protein
MIHETTQDFRIRYNLSQSGLNRTRMNGAYINDGIIKNMLHVLLRVICWKRISSVLTPEGISDLTAC